MSDHAQSLPAHVEWLVEHRGQALRSLLARENAHLDLVDALHVLVAADPSPGSHAVQWLCDGLITGGMRWEDVRAGARSRTRATLESFMLHRASLQGQGRNLEAYPTLGALNRALAPLVAHPDGPAAHPGGRAARRMSRLVARMQSLILCDTPELIVAVPTTRAAAQWWGRGTQWCTAALNDNMFSHYNAIAPLIVVCMPGIAEGKLQLHFYDGDEIEDNHGIQFMDVHDQEVTSDYIRQHWSRLRPLMEWLVTHHSNAMHYVPIDMLSPYLVEQAVRSYPWALCHLPEEERTIELCRIALAAQPETIRLVPEDLKTAAMVHDVIARKPELLGYVPHRLQTRDMCLASVSAVGGALRAVAPQYLDLEMCRAAIPTNSYVLEYVPDQYRTPELYEYAMNMPGTSLYHVPDQYRSAEVCLSAVTMDGNNLGYVPYELKTRALCTLAVQSNGNAIQSVPPVLQTPELCAMALAQYGRAILLMPPDQVTPGLCMRAVEADDMALHYIAPQMITAELVAHAIQHHPEALRYAPQHLMTRELSIQALSARPYLGRLKVFADVDDGVYLAMLGVDGDGLYYVPEDRCTLQMCAVAVGQSSSAVQYVPQHLLDSLEEVVGADVLNAHEWRAETALEGLASCLASPQPVQPTQILVGL